MPLEIGAMTELNLKMVAVLQMRRTVKKKQHTLMWIPLCIL